MICVMQNHDKLLNTNLMTENFLHINYVTEVLVGKSLILTNQKYPLYFVIEVVLFVTKANHTWANISIHSQVKILLYCSFT
jgi:hypothetical protein